MIWEADKISSQIVKQRYYKYDNSRTLSNKLKKAKGRNSISAIKDNSAQTLTKTKNINKNFNFFSNYIL